MQLSHHLGETDAGAELDFADLELTVRPPSGATSKPGVLNMHAWMRKRTGAET